MKIRFNPSEFEQHVADLWAKEKVYATKDPKPGQKKNYTLVMFPYPSGAGLHTGHARIYTGTDVLARYHRMNGEAVLHPMGWDAFGLPTENAAIKEHKNPIDVTKANVANFKRQMNMLGISYDWDREINTTDPSYYAVTQWLFIEFFKHGLLYKKDTPVYYCTFCKTGLAQEEVQGDGTHERCGNPVEKRNLPQWIFRITTYSEQLLKGLEGLDWPTGILEMQKNWIGKKEGLEIEYPVVGLEESISCFTTRPETNFGATFIVLSPEHSFVQKLMSGDIKFTDEALEQPIRAYVESALKKTERERLIEEKQKTGTFTGYYVTNRLNGESLPIWVSDFVLSNVGTGAVVGVPGHDQRDFAFAEAFKLPIKRVVMGPDNDTSNITHSEQVQEEEGVMIHSDFLNTLEIHEATKKMIAVHEEKGWGKIVTSYHLRDWIFSRQRYWGEPIPMVYCKKCAEDGISYWDTVEGSNESLRLSRAPRENNIPALIEESKNIMTGWFPLKETDLPLELPQVDQYEPTESGASPLSEVTEWVSTICPHCGGTAERETDTMPNWAGSCWYFLAFAAKPSIDQIQIEGKPWNEALLADWMPVDWYIGGAEHAVLHLLYARFWMHVLYDLNLIPFTEPFTRLRNVGMVLAEDNRKMSKSLGNVINPDDVVAEYGTDTLRVYEMFMAPFNQEVTWSTSSLQGAYRFVRRVWQIYHDADKITNDDKNSNKKLSLELQRLIVKISSDITNVKFNTPISGMMSFLNSWEEKGRCLTIDQAKTFLTLLAPFAPFITEQLWRTIFHEETSIHMAPWPKATEEALTESLINLPVQINGKVRDTIEVSPHATEAEVVGIALASEKISKWIDGKKTRHIYVPGRILNIVID